MRFLVDAQLPPRLVDYLRGKGCQAEHVVHCTGETAKDSAVVARANEVVATIVSKDADFASLLEGKSSPALLWVRSGNTTNRLLVARLDAQWSRIESELLSGKLIVEVT